jgi:3-methylcrotonyl-CoA carboxylase alpha subunit
LQLEATAIVAAEKLHVFLRGDVFVLTPVERATGKTGASGPETGLFAPMPGTIVALIAREGARVEKGEPLLILEAMKMEHTITAPAAGTVKAFCFAVGDRVADGAELVEFEAA